MLLAGGRLIMGRAGFYLEVRPQPASDLARTDIFSMWRL
jgi:hypothetical protein